MPRPLAILHQYQPDSPAALAAMMAAHAWTSSHPDDAHKPWPAAGSPADVTRISFGQAERHQKQLAAELRQRVEQHLAAERKRQQQHQQQQVGSEQAAAVQGKFEGQEYDNFLERHQQQQDDPCQQQFAGEGDEGQLRRLQQRPVAKRMRISHGWEED
eukprot:gene5273-5508_t